MAELIFRVSTDWQEVEKLFKEIEKLNGALNKVDTDTPRTEVEKLTSKISELKAKYEEMVSFSQQANDKLSDAFKNISSTDNPFKILGENSEKATKLLTESFDGVISKVCDLYDYAETLKEMINSLGNSSGIFTQIAENISILSDSMKNQELSLSNQAAQNNNIIQQHQMEITALSQQSQQTQNLTEAAGERVSVENEVASTIEDTASSIDRQTEALRSNTEAIKEKREEIKQVDDEYSNVAKSEERWLSNTIEGLEQQQREIDEKISNATDPRQIAEYERQYQQIEAQINRLKEDENDLAEETERVSEGIGSAFQIFKSYDESGNPFRIMADSAEDADEKIKIAKDSLNAYPSIMERISEKAEDMRLNYYMTDEGEKLIKEADRIAKKLESKGGLAGMFGANGENTGIEAVNRLSEIEEKLDNIHTNQKEIEAENERLAEQERILEEEEEKRHQASVSLRTQIMQTREEMIRLIAAGKQGTPEFMALAQKAGDMREQLQRANAYMQYFDDPNRGLTALKTGLQGVAGAAGLVTSTIGLFNEDSKKMAEIQTKVQSVLGVVVGLETTYNLVKKDGVLMMAIEEVKTWAIAKAKGVQAAATTAATTAQEGLNAAMLKNPYGAIIALLVTLGAAIWAVTKALTSETDAEKKAREEKEKHIKEIKKQQEDWANSVAQSASKQIMSYEELQRKWKELGDDMEKKKKFIKDNQTAFHGLGVSVDSVTSAENVLVKNTTAVVNAIMARAKAAAYQRVMEEQYEKEIKARLAADKASKAVSNGGSTAVVREGDNALNRTRAYYNAKEMGFQFKEGDTEEGKWTKQGVERIAYYNKLYKEKQKQAFNEREKIRRETSEKEIKATEKLLNSEMNEVKKVLDSANIKAYDGSTVSNNKKEENARKKKLEADRKLAELVDKRKREETRRAEDLEFSTRQAEIDAMDEGTDKRLAQIKLNHDKEINAIKRSYDDLKLKRIEEAKKVWEEDYRNEGKDFYKSEAYRNAKITTTRRRLNEDELADIQKQEMEILAQNGNLDIMAKLHESYGNGNVDIIARPVIEAARLAAAGWHDVGDGIATVYSMEETLLDADGNKRRILFTPILPDGNVMTPQEIDEYLKNVLEGAQDFLEADTNKLIIKVGEIGEDEDLGGEDLHIMQESLYKGIEEQIKDLYDNATDSEMENFLKRIVAVNKKYTEISKEDDKEKLKSKWNYLLEYGNELEQEIAITEKYQNDIDKARQKGDEYEAKRLEKKRDEAKNNMKLQNLLKDPEYIRAFEDLGNTSTETLLRLIRKFENSKAEAAKEMSPEKLREWTNTLQKLYDEVKERDPFSSLTKSLKELSSAHKEVEKWKEIKAKFKTDDEKEQIDVNGEIITQQEATKNLAEARDKEITATNKLKKAVVSISQTMASVGSSLSQLGNQIGGSFGDAMGAVGGVMGSIGDVMGSLKNYNANAKGFEAVMGNVSLITSAASAMISMNKQLDSILPDQESLYEHYAEKQKQINDQRRAMLELEISQLEERLKNEHWFYENGLTQLKKNAELNAEYAKLYGEVLASPQEIYKEASSGFSKWGPAIVGAIVGIIIGIVTYGTGAAAGVAAGTSIAGALGGALATSAGIALTTTMASILGSIILAGAGAALGNAVRAGIDGIVYKEGQTAAINNMRVQTRHKTFFRSEKTQDLEEWVRENWKEELYDKDFSEKYGVQIIDPEVAKKILEDGPTLVGETRETVEKLMEYSEKIHEFVEDIHEYVSQAFSPLVDNLTDALWDWLTEGKDVMDSFRDYAADTFKNIAQDAIKAMITKNIFEPFQKQLEDLTIAYSTGQLKEEGSPLTEEEAYMLGVSAIATDMQKVIETQLPIMQMAAENMQIAMESAGIDITGSSQTRKQQSASANSIENISYDQADALVGILIGHTIIFEQIKAILESWNGEPIGDIVSSINKVNSEQSKSNESLVKAVINETQAFEEGVSSEILKTEEVDDMKEKMLEALSDYSSNGIMAPDNSTMTSELTLLNANIDLLYSVGLEQRDIASDSRDILAGMAIHVEEIRDGVVDTIVPRIKSIDNELIKVRRLVEEQ